MALLETYKPNEVDIIFDGYNLGSGLDPNSWVKVTRNARKYSYVPSIDGGGARLLTSDNSAIIEVKIMQTSAVHSVLFALAKEDDGTNPESIKQLTIIDTKKDTFLSKNLGSFGSTTTRNGGMSYQKANNCYISNTPVSEYSDKIGSLTWEFTCSELLPLDLT